MSAKEKPNSSSGYSFNPNMWVDKKFIGHTGEIFEDDRIFYQAGMFGDTLLVEKWKDGDTVREAVNVEELPEGIQNQIKAAFAKFLQQRKR